MSLQELRHDIQQLKNSIEQNSSEAIKVFMYYRKKTRHTGSPKNPANGKKANPFGYAVILKVVDCSKIENRTLLN